MSERPRCLGWLSRRRWDAAGIAVALCLALPSFWYVHGIDQGIHAYVGNSVLRGAMPYGAGGVTSKPPLAILVHTISIALFGYREWSVRLVDVLFVLAMAVVGSRLVSRVVSPRDGLVGVCAITVATVHYVFFDWHGTAHPDFWFGLPLLGAALLASRDVVTLRAALWAGVLSGLAFLFKFTAAVPATAIAAYAGARVLLSAEPMPVRLRRVGLLAAAFVAGVAVPILLTLIAFAVAGGAGPMWEVLIEFLFGAYGDRDIVASPTRWLIQQSGIVCIIAGAGALAWVGWSRRENPAARRTALVLATLIASSIVCVAIPGLWYPYYWSCVTAGLATAIALGIASMPRGHIIGWASTFAAAALLYGPHWEAFRPEPLSEHTPASYREHISRVIKHMRGVLTTADLHSGFHGVHSWASAEDEVAAALLERMGPGDTLCVLTPHTRLYTLTGRHCTSRFQFMPVVMMPSWVDEQVAALSEHPPSFLAGFGLPNYLLPSGVLNRFQFVWRGPAGSWIAVPRGATRGPPPSGG